MRFDMYVKDWAANRFVGAIVQVALEGDHGELIDILEADTLENLEATYQIWLDTTGIKILEDLKMEAKIHKFIKELNSLTNEYGLIVDNQNGVRLYTETKFYNSNAFEGCLRYDVTEHKYDFIKNKEEVK